MPQPVTTAELLLAQVVDLLTEVRDLLRQPEPEKAAATPRKVAAKKPATKKTSAKS